MKKYTEILMSILFVFMTYFQSFAQFNQHNLILETSFKLNKKNLEESVFHSINGNPTFLPTNRHEVDYNISSGIGFFLTNNSTIGIMFDISQLKITEESQVKVINTSSGSGSTNFFHNQYEEKSTSILPGIYFRYFLKISKRFRFTPKISFQYEKQISYNQTLSINNLNRSISNFKRESEFINLGISGFFTYKVSKWLAIQTKVIDTRYRHKFYDSLFTEKQQNTISEYHININPLNWEYGILLIIGK